MSITPVSATDLRADTADGDTHRLAQELLLRCHQITLDMCPPIAEAVPSLVPASVESAAEDLIVSSEQNIGAVLAVLAYGVIPRDFELPTGTLRVLQNVVDGGGDVTSILRAYRVGHGLLWAIWAEHVSRQLDPERAQAVHQHSSRLMFTFFDQACEQIVAVYRSKFHDPLVTRGGKTSRRALIERLLGSEAIELGAPSTTLGYSLRGYHVALVITPSSSGSDVRDLLQRLAKTAGAALLFEPVGQGTWWAWLGWNSCPSPDVLDRIALTDTQGILVGLGAVYAGQEGFAKSHEQALEAERTARLSSEPITTIVRYRDVEIAALLCLDPDRARRIAAERLGDLGSRNVLGRRMRETLRTFLASGRNKTRTAELLNIHHKTVAYRVTQAESILGRSIAADAVDLEVALLIDATLNGP